MHAEAALSRDPAPAASQRCRVLLVEDSARLAASIRDYLERQNYEVYIEGDGNAVAERFDRLKPDLVILDLMLPGKDGLTICRELRRHDRIPILILTAKGENIDQVLGLEMGADDYVVKPFSLKELAARCRVALRRHGPQAEPARGYRDDAFEVEFDSFVARYRGSDLRLTAKEFELFRVLVESAGRVLTRERLLERVWGHDAEVDLRSVDAHVRRLRAKLGPGRRQVETVVGLGYRFVKDTGAPAAAG
jgi:DNA-binding response OmpR family regulator